MGKIAFLFPGQGSQAVGMGKDLAEKFPAAKGIFEKADQALGENLSGLVFNGPAADLTLTANCQPALLTVSTAVAEILKEWGIKPDYAAGHSLGEYSALVMAGVLSFDDAVVIVRKRGQFMEEAVPDGKGSMAAVLGMDRKDLEEIANRVSQTGRLVQLANINCPGQIVISGMKEGVDEAGESAKRAGAKKVIPLPVSGPFHSALMKPASEKLGELFQSFHFNDAVLPVISNVTARPAAEGKKIKQLLLKQLYSPVLWEDSIRTLIQSGVDRFVEIGPGKVLTGLVRKIDRNVQAAAVYDGPSLEAAMTILKGVTEK